MREPPAAAAAAVPVAPALPAPPVAVGYRRAVIAAAGSVRIGSAAAAALVLVPARVVPAVVPVVARVRRRRVPAAATARVARSPEGRVIARVQPSLAPEPGHGFVTEEEVLRRARGHVHGPRVRHTRGGGVGTVVVFARGSGRVRARRPRGAGAMERSPRLVGGLRRLRGPSLVVAGFLAGPAPRDGVRNQLRVGIVPGVLLRWWKRSRVSASRPPGADAFRRLLREKKRALRWLRVRASGRGRTFFMEGRFTGFGTDSFIAVAIVRPLLCGTGRIDGGEMVAKTKVKPIDGKRELQSGKRRAHVPKDRGSR